MLVLSKRGRNSCNPSLCQVPVCALAGGALRLRPPPKRCVPSRGSHLGVLQGANPQGLIPWVSPGLILALSPLGDLLGAHVCRTADSSQLVATGHGSPQSAPTLMGPDSSVHTQAIFSLTAVF